MSDAKSTKLKIREDRPTGQSSSVHGSNINALGFNILFIAQRNPKLAIEIMRLYAKASAIQADDPLAPDEDFALFADEVDSALLNKQDN